MDDDLRATFAQLVHARSEEHRRACVSPDDLARLVDRNAPESQRIATVNHVMQCAACMREFELLRVIATAAPPAPAARVTRWRVPLALAASIVIVVLVARRLDIGRAERVVRDAGQALKTVTTEVRAQDASRALVWHPLPGSGRYVVEILDAADDVIFTTDTGDSTAVLPASLQLRPGARYSWWVRGRSAGGAESQTPVVPLLVR
jgi:hypothetical protein